MSFFVQDSDGAFVRDNWGFPAALSVDKENARPFPTEYGDLCKVIQMVTKTGSNDKSRRVDVVVRNDNSEPHSLALIRFHGYLGTFNLHPLGDWNRTMDGCPSACNVLYLEPRDGVHETKWTALWTAVGAIRNWASAMCQVACLNKTPRTNVDPIRFSKRVFVRKNPLSSDHSASVLPADNEYLHMELTSVASKWIPESPITLGYRLEDGTVRRAAPAEFSQGDFVDVGASLDIIEGYMGIRILLRLEHVVLIRPAKGVSHPPMQVGQASFHDKRKAMPVISFAEANDSDDSMSVGAESG